MFEDLINRIPSGLIWFTSNFFNMIIDSIHIPWLRLKSVMHYVKFVVIWLNVRDLIELVINFTYPLRIMIEIKEIKLFIWSCEYILLFWIVNPLIDTILWRLIAYLLGCQWAKLSQVLLSLAQGHQIRSRLRLSSLRVRQA